MEGASNRDARKALARRIEPRAMEQVAPLADPTIGFLNDDGTRMDSGRTEEAVTAGAPSEALFVLGALAAELAPDDLGRSLDAVVDLLRAAAGADDCEIFLREPEGGDLVLAACCGSDRDALMEIVRFETGAGYPGIVAATGERLITRHLDRDRRFLRRRVTERGIVCFVSAPLWGTDGALGCIDFGWRDVDAPIERGAELLSKAARPIATTVRAGLLAARDLVDRAVDAAGPGLVSRAKACLEVIARSARARGATLALYDADGAETKVLATAVIVHICADAVDGKLRCRLLAEGHGVALTGPRRNWPSACRCLPNTTVSPLCLPLRSGRRLHGVAVLDRGDVPPNPPGRDLVPLLTMAAEAAARLVPDGAERSTTGATRGSATPVLELRCFGGFEVRLRGQPVPAEAFVRRKALTLLKLLVLSAGNPISREAQRLPGPSGRAPTDHWHALPRHEPYREQRRWIFATSAICATNMESPHWTDVFAFRRHAASATKQSAGPTRRSDPAPEAALGLYRGDLFGDEPYASWCELDDRRSAPVHRSDRATGRPLIAEGEPHAGSLATGVAGRSAGEDLHQTSDADHTGTLRGSAGVV